MIAYLSIGGLDPARALICEGMGVFHGYDANLTIQLWIAARYTESISLALAAFKIVSEYIICLIFPAVLAFLFCERRHFNPDVLCLLGLSIIATIAAEMVFTFYRSHTDMLSEVKPENITVIRQE